MSSTSSRKRTGPRTRSGIFHGAALHGSSHYDLPAVLRWFTGNIGIHHVHHLARYKVPFYRLPQVLEDHPELRDIGRITFMDQPALRQTRDVGRNRQAADHLPPRPVRRFAVPLDEQSVAIAN